MTATTSQIKAGLDDIASIIRAQTVAVSKAQQNVAAASAVLAALATDFADVVSTVQAFTPTGAFQTNAKDELAKLISEYQALKAKADAIAAQA